MENQFWKCKNCGERNFTEQVLGGSQKVLFDKDVRASILNYNLPKE